MFACPVETQADTSFTEESIRKWLKQPVFLIVVGLRNDLEC